MALPDDSEMPDAGALLDASEWMPSPTCSGCCAGMVPVGRGGWWCDPCQEFQ